MCPMKREDLEPYIKAVWSSNYVDEMNNLLESLPFRLDSRRVLDLAAGPGGLTQALLSAGTSEVVWQDVESRFAESALENLSDLSRVRIEVRDMMDLPYENAYFDAIFVLGALHWAHDERTLIRDLRTKVASEGWLVVEGLNMRRALGPDRSLVRRLAHLASPTIALLLRRKIWPTIWVFERLTRARLRRNGFEIVEWRKPAPHSFIAVARRSPS